MKYEDWRKQRRDSFSKLPLKAAFSQKQFEEMMSEWGLTTSEEDLQKLQPLGGGAYCLKTDYHLFIEWTEEQDRQQKEFLSDEEQLKDALIYEFGNYECGYTMDPKEAVRELFDDKEAKRNELLKKVLPIAWKEYLEKCDDY